MSKLIAGVLLTAATFTSVVNAASIKCVHRASKSELFDVTISYSSILKQSSFTALVKLNGNEISRFDHGDVDVKYFSKRFVAENNHGDVVSGKVMKIGEMIVKIEKFSITGMGLHFTDVTVDCE